MKQVPVAARFSYGGCVIDTPNEKEVRMFTHEEARLTAGRGAEGAPAVSVRNVAKRYGRRRVLTDVTFSIPAGTLVGIEGENGAGKSTLLKCLVGLLGPDSGEIQVRGTIGYCPQEPSLLDALTIAEQLRLFGAGYGLTAEQVTARGGELLETFGCTQYAGTRVSRLSGGTRQKVNLIASLLHTPDVLILDEPYQGFDYDTYLKFWDYAEQFRRDGGAVAVVSHMHSEKDRFDAMLDLVQGKVVASGRLAAQVVGGAE
jgi:ABC-type multidrug transport system ATPase subunit